MIVGLDFETKSDVDIRKHGLGPYFASPAFQILWAGISTERNRQLRIDFVDNAKAAEQLEILIRGNTVAAHNVTFERLCLQHLGLEHAPAKYIDSAVIARAMGAGGHLANAAPQLLGVEKMEEGLDLIKMFSVPQEDGSFLVDDRSVWDGITWDCWKQFGEYCELDAKLSRDIVKQYGGLFPNSEWGYEDLTYRMNQRGWTVDMESVGYMQKIYQENLVDLKTRFERQHGKLNFRSTPQLRKFCKDRGMRVDSFDELHVTKYRKSVGKKIDQLLSQAQTPVVEEQIGRLLEIEAMLLVKQELGGSSLSKLQTIIDMVDEDGQLRNQYMHVGAGQTFRTSGRGVQMQNLKRLGQSPASMSTLASGSNTAVRNGWTNEQLARNMRQVFTASHPAGALVVGDLSSIESRGLALMAGAHWKSAAYGRGLDMYKVLAEKMTGTKYDSVTKDQRQMGKVGELSCGYGAGPGAVQSFAEKMGMELDAEQAAQIVTDWRETNPEVVNMWHLLDEGLHKWVDSKGARARIILNQMDNIVVEFASLATPMSIIDLYPTAKTLGVTVYVKGVARVFRVFQGVHLRGQDICYLKPSELKSGPQWRAKWSKSGQTGYYKLYGGKLTGILTQSFCREIFFAQMSKLEQRLTGEKNAKIVGQFHDEIVVDWWPATGGYDLAEVINLMHEVMSTPPWALPLPTSADVKYDYRYIK